MNRIIKLSVFLIIIQFSSTAYAQFAQFSFGSKFFNYGNGAINLDHVTHIDLSWDYYYHYQNNGEDELIPYSEIPNKNTINNRVTELFGDGSVFENMEFYLLVNSSYIKFDDFTLTVLPETVHFKIPSCTEIGARDDLMEFAMIAEDYFFPYEDIGCNELREKQNILTPNEISRIKRLLSDTAETYDQIVN